MLCFYHLAEVNSNWRMVTATRFNNKAQGRNAHPGLELLQGLEKRYISFAQKWIGHSNK